MYKRWSCFTVQVFEFKKGMKDLDKFQHEKARCAFKTWASPSNHSPEFFSSHIFQPWPLDQDSSVSRELCLPLSRRQAVLSYSTVSPSAKSFKPGRSATVDSQKNLELRGCPQCDHAQLLDYQKPKWFRLCTRTTRWWKFDEPCSPFLRGIPIPIRFNTCKQPNDQNQTNILYLHYSEIHRLCMDRPCIMTHWQWVGLM